MKQFSKEVIQNPSNKTINLDAISTTNAPTPSQPAKKGGRGGSRSPHVRGTSPLTTNSTPRVRGVSPLPRGAGGANKGASLSSKTQKPGEGL